MDTQGSGWATLPHHVHTLFIKKPRKVMSLVCNTLLESLELMSKSFDNFSTLHQYQIQAHMLTYFYYLLYSDVIRINSVVYCLITLHTLSGFFYYSFKLQRLVAQQDGNLTRCHAIMCQLRTNRGQTQWYVSYSQGVKNSTFLHFQILLLNAY